MSMGDVQIFGVDISLWQPNFNFVQAKAEGVRFVIIKAGGADGDRSNNYGLYQDPAFERHYKEAMRCGLGVGVYFYGMARNAEDGKREFEFLLNIIKDKALDYPVWYDIEDPSLKELGIKDFTPGIDAFLGNFKKAGYLSGIYANNDWFYRMDGDYITSEYEFWRAYWSSVKPENDGLPPMGLWQYGGGINPMRTNIVAGQVCDQDFAFKDYPKIIRSNGLNKFDKNFTYYATTYDSAIAGTAVSPRKLLKTDNITPYIVTINRNTKSLDINSLKNFGVVGIVVEAGRLFDALHYKMEYRNPKLVEQLKVIQDGKVPFGLYADVCARNIAEAKEELYELKFIVRAYPPNIGVWLRLNLTGSRLINDQIIALYKQSLESWGFDGSIGLYATKEQIDRISWREKWHKDLYLWLDDHLETLDGIDELLTPSLFSV